MELKDFDFNLPKELIANYPLQPRDSSRLLVIDDLSELQFKDLPQLLKPNDLLIFNNSKVIPARLYVQKGERKIEIFLHKRLKTGTWQAFAKPAKKLKVGDTLPVIPALSGNLVARSLASMTVLDKLPSGEVVVELDENIIEQHGHMPLPPYIERADDNADKTSYQTVYAAHSGSVAAPTAGLHFTDELLAKIPNKAFVTLHVGAGTFLPVKTENLDDHKMHSEWYEVPPETAEAIKSCTGRVIAVGTTSLRTLEASGGKAGSGETQIFITPGYKFKVVDALITNFHLPKSTLFMLVCAMTSIDKMQSAYKYAIENKFRFFSYGDGCFIGN